MLKKLSTVFLIIFGRISFKELKEEFSLYDKKLFLLVSASWCIMLISFVKAYEYGDISVAAPFLALTTILNAIYEYIIDKDRKDLMYKLFISILIIIGVILIKI